MLLKKAIFRENERSPFFVPQRGGRERGQVATYPYEELAFENVWITINSIFKCIVNKIYVSKLAQKIQK